MTIEYLTKDRIRIIKLYKEAQREFTRQIDDIEYVIKQLPNRTSWYDEPYGSFFEPIPFIRTILLLRHTIRQIMAGQQETIAAPYPIMTQINTETEQKVWALNITALAAYQIDEQYDGMATKEKWVEWMRLVQQRYQKEVKRYRTTVYLSKESTAITHRFVIPVSVIESAYRDIINA